MHFGAIPSTLSRHLCIDFVNSRFEDYRGRGQFIDRLELQEWRQWFASRCGLGQAPALDHEDHARLVEFRSYLRQQLELARPPGRPALGVINSYLASSAQWPELVAAGDGLRLQARWTQPGWSALVAVVAGSYARLLVDGTAGRVRVCANPACTWMFVDDSPAGSRRWCDVAVCGNLVRVRRHRERQALQA